MFRYKALSLFCDRACAVKPLFDGGALIFSSKRVTYVDLPE